MYLVEDNRHGTTYLVFTWEDPQKTGYSGPLRANIELDYDMEAVHSWPNGHEAPEECVGRSTSDPNQYKVFRNSRARQSENYEPVEGMVAVFGSWRDYLKLLEHPPKPNQIGEVKWYDYLDEVDDDTRDLLSKSIDPPTNGNRDEVAAWVAKKHFIADSSIREVWYLPRNAPPDEIRLLELNGRLTGIEPSVQAIDFGLDIEGARFRLLVADITNEQLELIRQDPSRLPSGWLLDGCNVWGRAPV